MVKFVHLKVHTEYSMIDGMITIPELIDETIKNDCPAVAITESNNLFSLVKFYKKSINSGVKPIVGSDFYIENKSGDKKPFLITLFIKNKNGYKVLSELISKAYQEGQKDGIPVLKKEWIKENCSDLICLSGALNGEIGKLISSGEHSKALDAANYWNDLFPDNFYLELNRVNKDGEEEYIEEAIKISKELGIPVVATNNVRFKSKTDFNSHDIRVCINKKITQSNILVKRDYTEEQYLKTQEEMVSLFYDIPSALENSVEIAKRCTIDIVLGEFFLPDFPSPKGVSLPDFFASESRKGLKERLDSHLPVGSGSLEENTRIYDDRLEFELGIINQMGFPGYFMIVADFIKWAKENKIPVGPGRGSGAGSLVAYSLKITDLDPIEFDLLFERFLNPERVSMPDFDIDFCMDRRDEVIAYVAGHYGKEKVSQIITYGSMTAKSVIRDVGRTLGHNYGFVDGLAKLIPNDVGITLTEALEESSELKSKYQREVEVKELFDLSISLEGTKRNAGKHAGGVVIAPTKISDFTPLYCDEEGNNLVTQYDKDDVESVGLVKFDFLGLRTLTIIDWALQNIVKNTGKEIDIISIPKNDKKTFQLLLKAETTAVFQLESRGMKELIKKLKPDCFDDIIALVALFRPGPLEAGMVDDYIAVKHGAKAEYAHPILEPILKPTNGVILYQEQVMEIARKMAGYSLGAADLLRRAMGKKKPEEMAKQRESFTIGSVNNKVPEEIATGVFDLMEKFAGYGFNKSHSAAYALIAYQTAWLKAHYPSEFMAAVLSSDMDNTDKMVLFTEECKEKSLNIINPSINKSEKKFTVNEKDIIYGIGAIKGVGDAAIDEIIKARKNGVFNDFYDFCARVDLRKVNKRVLEALVKSGSLDCINDNRASHFFEIAKILKVSEKIKKDRSSGQFDVFGFEEKKTEDLSYYHKTKYWSGEKRLQNEKKVLGFYISGHPVDEYKSEIKTFGGIKIKNLENKTFSSVKIVGQISLINIKQTRKNETMASVLIDDGTGKIEVAFFSDTYEKYKDELNIDQIIFIKGKLKENSYTKKSSFSVEEIQLAKNIIGNQAKGLKINLDSCKMEVNKFIVDLKSILNNNKKGNCPIYIDYIDKGTKVRLLLPETYNVSVTDNLIDEMKNKFTEKNVKILR